MQNQTLVVCASDEAWCTVCRGDVNCTVCVVVHDPGVVVSGGLEVAK